MVHQHIFRLRCQTSSIPHVPGGGLNVADLLHGHHPSQDLNSFYFFFWSHLKSLVYETPVATLEDLMTRIVAVSADIASTLDLFVLGRQYLVRQCRLCYDLHDRNFEQSLRQSVVVAFLTSSCDTLFVF
ncbi:uncharacterized protein TNCV_2737181 [Trichonephila clavipes]|nr:uncharacterized protein TNCV_2737181 [Trichonephila clavipes]